MSEKSVCHNCGYMGPEDATYCARCGRALVPPSTGWASRVDAALGKFSPVHIGFLGLILSLSISAFAAHLIVTGLSFRWSLVLLALVLGCGCAYLGWQSNTSAPSDRRIVQMLLIFACMGILLAVVLLIDRAWLSILSAGGDEVVYAIPGVYVEASAEGRRLVIDDAPPYWLVVMVYAVVTAVVGNLVHRVQGRWRK